MEKKILNLLMEYTDIEGLYTGGGHEPQVIIFKHSHDWDKEDFLSMIADRIANELKKD